ncbi:sensor histidine kinase [Rhodoferax aquaticus]|nr:HAMP domain-containing sensor histidine kinase [Rhodoferax aquaticus]
MVDMLNAESPPRLRAWGRALSLKRSIVVGIALGILLPALIVGPFLAREIYVREIQARSQTLLHQYASMLEQTMPNPIWYVDAPAAQAFVNSVMLNPDVVRILVEDASLGHLVLAEKPNVPKDSRIQEMRTVVRNGLPIGRITVDMTTAQVEQQFFYTLVRVAAALLVQLVVSCLLLFWLFEGRLMRPLRQLHRDADRLAGGELASPVLAVRDDEIGALAHGMDHMRSQLFAFQSELEQRVQERTQALETANQELLQAMATLKNAQDEIQRTDRLAALGALVAGVAHELNTPIGVCVTVASTLRETSDSFEASLAQGVTRGALSTYVSHNQQGTEILMRSLAQAAELIGGFKQVAVDRTSAQRRVFDLHAMVVETAMTIGISLKHSNHQLLTDVPTGIHMDSYPGPLGQVFSNLIANAVLHAFGPGVAGRVTVSARSCAPQAVELRVQDNGCGITPANLNRIFDPFFTTRLGQGGSGLGLNIVYNLVTVVLGGSIRVESTVNQGTTFVMVLPLTAPNSVTPEPACEHPDRA